MSYGLSVELLTEVLPIAEEISPTSVRRHLQRVAERIEGELGEEQFQFIEGCPGDWAKLPPPGPPLTVGLDGGYVHASDLKSKSEGWFEVIAGKSVQTEGGAKVFAFVNKYDTKPRRRLYEVLKSQGLQMNQQVVFLSDGGDTVRDLQHYLSPESEHLLDWFHITMRLTVMKQMVKGMTAELKPDDKHPETATGLADLERHLESVKWNLWHGNVLHALQRIDDLGDDLEMLEENLANQEETGESSAGIPQLYRGQPGVHSELRRPLPARRDDLHSVCQVDRELRGQQALCEKTADALDPARRASAAANPRTGPERRSAENLRSLVSGNESGRTSGAKGGDIAAPAPGMARSRCRSSRRCWPPRFSASDSIAGDGSARSSVSPASR